MVIKMKKILVTGVTGFIGSHLALELSQKKGYQVFGLVKFSTSRDMKALQPFLKDTILITGNIEDYHSIANILKNINPDIVVHLAALSPVRESFEKPFSYIQSNVVGTLNIAHAMLELPDFKKKKMIYASSAEVYGPQKVQPIKEDAVLNPSSPYSNTKAMTDVYLRMMANVYGLKTIVLRNNNTYGRKHDASFFIEYVITTMLKGDKLYIGAPDSIRDYMYVSDHVNSYIKAIESEDVSGEAFNVDPRNPISNKDVAFKIADIIGYDKENIILGQYPPNYPMRPIESDQPFITLDATKIKNSLGWEPKVSLDDGLKKAIEYWKQKLGV